jgi:hypothetical protein
MTVSSSWKQGKVNGERTSGEGCSNLRPRPLRLGRIFFLVPNRVQFNGWDVTRLHRSHSLSGRSLLTNVSRPHGSALVHSLVPGVL